MSRATPIRVRVLVRGRVQGVWFRDACQTEARAHGVSGWVRNLRDGRVEAVFEGSPDAVERMIDWCAVGPPRAVVTNLEQRTETPEGLSGFAVK